MSIELPDDPVPTYHIRGALSGTKALVTGASRGLGAAAAKALARAGCHVILAARTVGGLEEVDDSIRAEGGLATLVPLDLEKLDEIAPLGPALFERFGGLDILVAAAGSIGHLGPLAQFEPRAWDRVLAVNATANHRLILTLDPLLRVSEHGRAVFVTDRLARFPDAYWSAYASAKAALEVIAASYAAETRGTRLRVNLFEPPPMRTALRAQAFPGEDPSLRPTPESVAPALLALLQPDFEKHGQLVRA